MNDEIPNDEGWGNLIGPKKIKKIQEKYGIPPHEHTNGLISCNVCIGAVVWGNKNPFQDAIDALKKELFGDKDESGIK